MSDIKKVIEALSDNNDKLLLSDVSNSFAVGDLKEIIVSAMIKQRQLIQPDEDMHRPLKDWQIRDTKVWHFKEWLENYC